MQKLTRRGMLGGLAAVVTGGTACARVETSPLPQARPVAMALTSMTPRAEALIAKANLGGPVSFAVANGATGELLYARDATRPMAPASTAKLLTTAYALAYLGADYRFTTRVLATGPLVNGRIEGDLILAGGGDPSLTSDEVVTLVGQLQALGVRSVAGAFQVWGGALPYIEEIDPGQPDHLGYNPALSGLNLNYNRVFFQWQRAGGAYDLTLDARAERITPPVRMVSMQTVARAAPIYTVDVDARSGREAWTVARPALGDSGSRWLPVRGTAQYAGEVFRTIAAGATPAIHLPQPTFPNGIPAAVQLARVDSQPLSTLLRDMLRYSTNLTAEVVGLTATSARIGARPASLAHSAGEMDRWLQGQGAAGASMVDHSGLGAASKLTTVDMVGLLTRMGANGPLWSLIKPTVLKTPQGQPERFELRAKTGTLNFVSCLSGYVQRPNGAPLVFSIETAEPSRRAAIAPGDEERPDGGQAWARRSRELQHNLIRLWAAT